MKWNFLVMGLIAGYICGLLPYIVGIILVIIGVIASVVMARKSQD